MFNVSSGGLDRNCEGYTRRDLLKIGTLGIGGLTLADLLRLKAEAKSKNSFIRDKSVVLLFLQGGPTQIETFDPKMTAPAEYRAMFGETKTNLPGVTFGSHFPRLASMADRLAVVRSYSHGIGNHQTAAEHVAAGGNVLGSSMGTLYSRVAGTTHPQYGIPRNVILTPSACGEQYKSLSNNAQRVVNTGTLPKSYKTFDPSAGGQILENMELRIPQSRLDDRKTLLSSLDNIRRHAESDDVLGEADKFHQQAFDVILGGVGKAFDISQEDPRLLEAYDTSRFTIPAKIQKKKPNVPGQSPVSLGKQMLMARRLCEAGCGFVTVTSAGWDMHGNAFGVNDGMPILGPAVDTAVGAFLDDVHERGLSDKILLIITGEFGRTPRINPKGGRDHWGNLCTLAFAGGGLRTGQVVGVSDKTAGKPIADPVSSGNLLSTVMNTLFDISELRLERGLPTDVAQQIASGTPIPQLI